VPENQ